VDHQVQNERRKGFGSDLNISYGSYNSVNGSATASYGTDKYDGIVGFAYKRSDVPESGNGKQITDIYPGTNPNRYRANTIDSKAYEIFTGWSKFGFNPTENSRTEISYSYQDAEHVLYPYLKMDADYDKTHLLNWNYKIENVSPLVRELKLQAYWDRVGHLMDDRLRFSSTTSPRYYSMQTDARTQDRGQGAGHSGSRPGNTKGGWIIRTATGCADLRGMYTMANPFTPVNMIPDVFVDNFGMFTEYNLPLSGQFDV